MGDRMAGDLQQPWRVSRTADPVVSSHHKSRIRWATILLVSACFVSVGRAASVTIPPTAAETLVLDTNSPVWQDGAWTLLPCQDGELRRRHESITTTIHVDVSTLTSDSHDSSSSSLSSSSLSSSSSPSSSSSSTSTVSASPLPSPFDSGSLAADFRNDANTACPQFFNTFLASAEFKQCYPFSMLLQGSQSFFEAERSLVSITQVLDASCAANVTSCTTYLTALAHNLTSSANCGSELQSGNPVVNQAYFAMLGYQSLYAASCLKDPETSIYCFGDAVTNLTTASNVYFYFLPLNSTFPGSSEPSCNWCNQQTMAIFRSAAANRNLPIAQTYVPAAQIVDTICGPNFVNATLPEAIVAGALASVPPLPLAVALGAAAVMALQLI